MPSLPQELETPRLLLRRWRESDRIPFAAINADPQVMEHFPSCFTLEESNALFDRIQKHFDDRSFGLWAVEVRDDAAFIGFVGLVVPRFEAHFTPCIDIGWRLAASHWGHGYATEGAVEALEFAFSHLAVDEVVAMTTPVNQRSIRVMEKLGMTRNADDDFDHPLVADGHPLRRHVLYRLQKSAFRR